MVVNCEQVWQEISNYLKATSMRRCAQLWMRTSGHANAALGAGGNAQCDPVVWGRADDRGTRGIWTAAREEAGTECAGEKQALAHMVDLDGSAGGDGFVCGGLRVANSVTVPHLKSELAQPGHGIPPDMKVVVSTGARTLHAPGCGVIHNKDTERTLTAKEAIQRGYVPCMRCLREYLHTASSGAYRARSGKQMRSWIRTK